MFPLLIHEQFESGCEWYAGCGLGFSNIVFPWHPSKDSPIQISNKVFLNRRESYAIFELIIMMKLSLQAKYVHWIPSPMTLSLSMLKLRCLKLGQVTSHQYLNDEKKLLHEHQNVYMNLVLCQQWLWQGLGFWENFKWRFLGW